MVSKEEMVASELGFPNSHPPPNPTPLPLFGKKKKRKNIDIRDKLAIYLEAGVVTKTLINDGVRGDPFINDDQPDTCPGTLRGTWLLRALT
jgi:hypothetical protein